MTQEPELKLDRVFFPLAMIPAQEQGLTLALFQYADKNLIDIVHSTDSIGVVAHKVVSPQAKNQGIITVQLFYGACDDKDHFREVFGFDYDLKKSATVPQIVLQEIQAMQAQY